MDGKARPERRCLARPGPGFSVMPSPPPPGEWPRWRPHCMSSPLSPSPFCGMEDRPGPSRGTRGLVLKAHFMKRNTAPTAERALSVREAQFPAPPPFLSGVSDTEQTPLGAVPRTPRVAARQATLDPGLYNCVPPCLFLGTHQSSNHTPLAPGCCPDILPVPLEPQPRDRQQSRELARAG